MGDENMKTWAYLGLGAAAYYANDLPVALAYYSEGVRRRYRSNVLASDQCLVGLALTYQALGQPDEARGVLAIMRDFHQELANPLLNVEYRSLQARMALLNGDIPTARQWNRDTSTDNGLALGWIIVPAITNIRIQLADHPSPADIAEILAELDRLLTKLTRLRQPNRQIELLSLRALALEAHGDRLAAMESLEEALALAEPRGLVRPVVDAGRQLEPLLEALAVRRPSAYLTRLLAAFRPPTSPAARQGQPAPRLTPREREVLVLLAQYYTDRLIAETLVVSPLTVRTHIENLAEKLGVRGRRTIVDRARELALLP
jgi:LuxR family maltose regulon positive regulatory protein